MTHNKSPVEPSHLWRVTRGNANHANLSPSDLRVNSWTALVTCAGHLWETDLG